MRLLRILRFSNKTALCSVCPFLFSYFVLCQSPLTIFDSVTYNSYGTFSDQIIEVGFGIMKLRIMCQVLLTTYLIPFYLYLHRGVIFFPSCCSVYLFFAFRSSTSRSPEAPTKSRKVLRLHQARVTRIKQGSLQNSTLTHGLDQGFI